MARMKELKEENRRFKKMSAEERLKAEIVAEVLTKNNNAISSAEDGVMGRDRAVSHSQARLSSAWHQLDLLPVQSEARSGRQPHC